MREKSPANALHYFIKSSRSLDFKVDTIVETMRKLKIYVSRRKREK
jgi:hypothetical protein